MMMMEAEKTEDKQKAFEASAATAATGISDYSLCFR